MKNVKYMLLALLPLILSACSNNNLTTSKNEYQADQMVATVKGTTNSKSKVTYQINNSEPKNASNNNGTFIIQVPRSNVKQNIKIKSHNQNKTLQKDVSVNKSNDILAYSEFAQKYNYIAMQQGNNKTIPLTINNGIKSIVNEPLQTIRVDVQNNNLMAVTLIYPFNKVKNKTDMRKIGMSIAMMSSLVGANGKQVLNGLSKTMKESKNGQTTFKTIKSNGINFHINVSTNNLYLYITK